MAGTHRERRRLSLVLGGIAASAAFRGTAYIGWNHPPPALGAIDTLAPFWVYSLIWFSAATLAAVAAFERRFFNAAIATTAALWTVWGAAYVIAAIANWTEQSHLAGTSFLLIALLITHAGKSAHENECADHARDD